MKRIEPEAIGDILRVTLQEANMISRLDECRAADLLETLMGAAIAGKTSRPRVTNGVMTVSVESAPLRQELNMNRGRIMEMINKELGSRVLTEIKFK